MNLKHIIQQQEEAFYKIEKAYWGASMECSDYEGMMTEIKSQYRSSSQAILRGVMVEIENMDSGYDGDDNDHRKGYSKAKIDVIAIIKEGIKE